MIKCGFGVSTIVIMKFKLLGGEHSNGYFPSNEIYSFTFSSNCWELIKSKGTCKPSQRRQHSAIVYKDKMIINRGHIGSTMLKDMYEFNFKTFEWKHIKQFGDVPCGRRGHQCIVSDNLLIQFGGTICNFGPIQFCNDLYSFDLNNNFWKKIATNLSIANRIGSSVCYYKGYLIIFGGFDDEDELNDLFAIQLSNLFVTKIRIIGREIKNRSWHTCNLHDNGSMFIVGGEDYSDAENPIFHNDIYEVKLQFWETMKNVTENFHDVLFSDLC